MTNFTALLLAHGGHPHAGSEFFHHALEIGGLLAVFGVAFFVIRSVRARSQQSL